MSRIVQLLALEAGYGCLASVYKGGAQKRGSFHSQVRIVDKSEETKLSADIADGTADLLLALDPWEALRWAKKCNQRSKVISNTQFEPVYAERTTEIQYGDPLPALKQTYQNLFLVDLDNIQMLLWACEQDHLPFAAADVKTLAESLIGKLVTN